MATLRPEQELVLACARTRLDAAHTERILRLSAGGLDWARVMETSLEQYLLPLVSAHLAATDPPGLPQGWLDGFRKRYDRNARRSLYLTSHLLSVLDAFDSAGITAVPYKGPVLAALAYGDLGLRAFDDLDFLIPHRDLPRVYEQLGALSFEAEIPRAVALSPRGAAPGQYLFHKDRSQCVVEVHTERTLRYYPKPLDVEGFLSRAIQVPLAGRRVPSFTPEDLLTMLSVHASKHFWGRLLWVCDVAELVQRADRFNWDAAIERADRGGCERMVLLGLWLADALLGAPLPEEVKSRARATPQVPALGRGVASSLFRDEETVPGLAERFLFRVRMSRSVGAGVRYSFRLLTSPTEEDRQWARWASGSLAPVQRALRPLRLLRKYGSGLVRRAAPDLAPPRADAGGVHRGHVSARGDPSG